MRLHHESEPALTRRCQPTSRAPRSPWPVCCTTAWSSTRTARRPPRRRVRISGARVNSSSLTCSRSGQGRRHLPQLVVRAGARRAEADGRPGHGHSHLCVRRRQRRASCTHSLRILAPQLSSRCRSGSSASSGQASRTGRSCVSRAVPRAAAPCSRPARFADTPPPSH